MADIARFSDRMIILTFALASTLALGMLSFDTSEATTNAAVVFPPWIDGKSAATLAADAGARLMRAGRYPFIIVVRPSGADYAARVRQAGAWAVLDASSLGGCLSRNRGTT